MKKRLISLIGIFFYFVSFSPAQDHAIADAINKNTNIQLAQIDSSHKSHKTSLWQGWTVGLNFGATKFHGDISQYDHYPSYQQSDGFFELATAVSFHLEKAINSVYSIATELSLGKFTGLRRANEYLGYNVHDPWSGNYEGNGDKFVTSFAEADLLVNIDLANLMSYFSNTSRGSRNKKIHLDVKLGIGFNLFNSLRKNLYTDTYIYDFGYVMESGIDLGKQKKSLFNQTSETVYVYGVRGNYKLNSKMSLNLDYTIRDGLSDKWDASLMDTQNKSDQFAFISIGIAYKIGNHDFNNDWTNPIDVLKNDMSALNVRIEGFTDDSDNDGVSDAFDKSPDTPLGVAVDGSGNALDVDMDNIPDYRDTDPFSNKGALVDRDGVELDNDQDGVPDSKDLESNTPIGVMVNQFGMNIGNSLVTGAIYLPSIFFNSGSAIVDASNKNRIATIALLLKNNQDINFDVIGHTDNVGPANFNKELGLKRANAVIKYLVDNFNIDSRRFIANTKGEEDPLSKVSSIIHSEESNVLANPPAEINRRVDFKIRR